MSHANIFSPFSAAIVNAIHTEYLETIDKYVIDYVAVVVCLLLHSCAFMRNFFTQFDIKYHMAFDILAADWSVLFLFSP